MLKSLQETVWRKSRNSWSVLSHKRKNRWLQKVFTTNKEYGIECHSRWWLGFNLKSSQMQRWKTWQRRIDTSTNDWRQLLALFEWNWWNRPMSVEEIKLERKAESNEERIERLQTWTFPLQRKCNLCPKRLWWHLYNLRWSYSINRRNARIIIHGRKTQDWIQCICEEAHWHIWFDPING